MPQPRQPSYNSAENRMVAPESDAGSTLQQRTRVTAAQVNAGLILLAAVPQAYRLLSAVLIAIGGAAAGATAVVLQGVRATTTVSLLSVDVAGLTRSTPVRMGDAAAVVLADGASHTALDTNTPITIAKTGGTLTGATHIDVVLTYALD
jgi:hypothetical protein